MLPSFSRPEHAATRHAAYQEWHGTVDLPMLLRSSKYCSSCCSRTGPAKLAQSLTKMRTLDCAQHRACSAFKRRGLKFCENMT